MSIAQTFRIYRRERKDRRETHRTTDTTARNREATPTLAKRRKPL
jgi:hypothetical protein